jgi:hypothetical protein
MAWRDILVNSFFFEIDGGNQSPPLVSFHSKVPGRAKFLLQLMKNLHGEYRGRENIK